jgi:F-type H+-transporting ATPase subunit delta
MANLADTAGTARGQAIADDLNAIAHFVSRTNDVAVAMTDFGVPAPARRALLQDLLASRVDAVALRIVLRAVDTERVDEFPTVLHELYELARHVHDIPDESLRALEPVLSRGAWRDYMTGYAEAVLTEASSGELEEIEDELFRFARVVESNPTLRSTLSDSSVLEGRERIVDDLLADKVHRSTLRLVRLTLQGRARDLAASLDWLVEQAARARGWRVARVHAALPIEADEQRALCEALERLTGQPVELQILLDPETMGGAVIEVGDLLVDASVRRRLEQIEEHLLGHEGATQGAQH